MITSKWWFGTLITALYIILGLLAVGFTSRTARADEKAPVSAEQGQTESKAAEDEKYVPKSKAELRKMLTRLQYEVTQNEGTETAFRNKYWNNKKPGQYHCIVCDLPLFSSQTKYKSGTGWPSFYAPLKKEVIGTRTDWRLFYSRIEVHCARCGAHLGHVFDDGPQPTGLRYCMNSAALKFHEQKEGLSKEDDAKGQ